VATKKTTGRKKLRKAKKLSTVKPLVKGSFYEY